MGFLKEFADKYLFKTGIKEDEITMREIIVGYFLAPFCAVLANAVFSAYLARYYADVLGWTEIASGAFAAALPIFSAVFVAFGSLWIGRKIDSTRTAAGKARPYLLVSAPLLMIAILFLFSSPRSGSPLQMIWIALSYNMYYVAAYPCYYTAHSSMVSLSTRDTSKRGLLATVSNASGVAAAGIGASIFVPFLLQGYMFVNDGDSLDTALSYSHWRRISVVLAVLTAAGAILEYLFTRERITEETMNRQKEEKAIPIRKHMKACLRDRFWCKVMLFVFFYQMGQILKNTSMSFYVRWMFDTVTHAPDPEIEAGALMSTLGFIGGLPAVAGMIIAWPLSKKLGKKRAIVLGLIFSAAGGAAAFLDVHSFAAVCTGVVLKAIGIIPAQYVILAVISDILDYLEIRNGFRSDGFTMSIYSAIIISLLGIAFGIVSGLLGAAGYDASFETQPAAVERVLVFVYLAADMIAFLLAAVILWKMNVEKFAAKDLEWMESGKDPQRIPF